MSLNKTLDRLFAEIRREARRNPDFADRLDAVVRAHVSRRDVPDELVEAAGEEAPAKKLRPKPRPKLAEPVEINPVGLLQREGEQALDAALSKQDRDGLLALIAEHNLDPGGQAEALDRDALAAHVIAQAKRRVERDRKLFDY
jgi:hypothetical protein